MGWGALWGGWLYGGGPLGCLVGSDGMGGPMGWVAVWNRVSYGVCGSMGGVLWDDWLYGGGSYGEGVVWGVGLGCVGLEVRRAGC